MMKHITPHQLANIIKILRKQKNISQEQVAKVLGIPRTAISQIENGGRELSFTELQKLLNLFVVSFDEFTSIAESDKKKESKKDKKMNKKIKFEPEKFKQLFLYILEKCGSKPNVGETVLYKLLYFCDFNYFEICEKSLTGMKYKKMQFGPIPDQSLFNPTLNDMIQLGMIAKVSKPYINGMIQTRYLNFAEVDLSVFGADIEKMIKVVDATIERLSSMSARMIEEHSHNDYPWQVHEFEQEIDYSTVFYRSGEFANRDYDQEFIESAATDVDNDFPPLSKEEYNYYMSLPDKE